MNNKIMIFGSIFFIFLLLVLPTINAVEYNAIESSFKEAISKEFGLDNVKQAEQAEVDETSINNLKQTLASTLLGGIIKKLLSIPLFLTDFVFIILYFLSAPLVFDIANSLINLISENFPIFSVILSIYLPLILMFLAMQPSLITLNILERIGGFDKEKILKIHNILLMIGGGLVYLMQLFGIIDSPIPDLNTHFL
jgi:hypothetical protein